MRFVVADDSSIPRDIVRGALRRNGHLCVGLAVDGSEAVAICAKERPDVVILDVSMKPMGGVEAAHAIHAAGTAKHIVIASSASMDSVFGALRAIGCKTLAKPFKRETLAQQIEALVSDGTA